MQKNLWDHQTYLYNEVKKKLEHIKNSKILVVSPTGSGKTTIAYLIASSFKRILIITHRNEIVKQIENEFNKHNDLEYFLVISPIKAKKINPNLFDALIIDEAHRSCAASYRFVISLFNNKPIIGLTATPVRSDGQSLNSVFGYIIEGPQIPDLQEMNILTKTIELSTPLNIDLNNIPISKKSRDYVQGALSVKMRNVELYSNVIREFKKNAINRKNITYCVDVKHAIEMADYYKQNNISAVCVSGYNSAKERKEIYNDFQNGKIQVLTNCLIYTEGVDIPDIECITSLRPTHSLVIHYQSLGRGLRVFPGKNDCMILDHSGNIQKHGSISDRRIWPYKSKGREFIKSVKERKDPKSKINVQYNIYEDVSLMPYVNKNRPITQYIVKNLLVEYNFSNKTSMENICNKYGYSFKKFNNFLQANKGLNTIYMNMR